MSPTRRISAAIQAAFECWSESQQSPAAAAAAASPPASLQAPRAPQAPLIRLKRPSLQRAKRWIEMNEWEFHFDSMMRRFHFDSNWVFPFLPVSARFSQMWRGC